MSCPFASMCSCPTLRPSFRLQPGSARTVVVGSSPSGARPVALASSPIRATADDEITRWTDEGWKVVSTGHDEVVLRRERNLPFCLNAFLSLATGFLWLIYWIPRSRNPKVETKVVALSSTAH